MSRSAALAREAVSRCRLLASHSEESGHLTRTFLCDAMRAVHADVRQWMEQAGMQVHIDPAGNIRGLLPGAHPEARRLMIGSHLDTVPNAGAFDGPLGVMLGIGLVEALEGRRRDYAIEVIGFSEEEGVRFGIPFIGSRALIGELDEELLARRDANGISVADAIRSYGLDPAGLRNAEVGKDALGYLEFHIEQGPVLESLGLPLGVVRTIVGQARLELRFEGHANHAGTTPMHLRRDALTGASEWIGAVERYANGIPDLVATVGRLAIQPGAGNVIPGSAVLSLDVRHPDDGVRRTAVGELLRCAEQIASRRRLQCSHDVRLDQPAVAMDARPTEALARAIESRGLPLHSMNSGAGHDAMIVARRVPSAMLFLRCPGGVSHHPDESVWMEDVAAAFDAGMQFLEDLENTSA